MLHMFFMADGLLAAAEGGAEGVALVVGSRRGRRGWGRDTTWWSGASRPAGAG